MVLKTVVLPMLMWRKRKETSVVTLMLTMGTFIRGCTYAISFPFGSPLSRANAHSWRDAEASVETVHNVNIVVIRADTAVPRLAERVA